MKKSQLKKLIRESIIELTTIKEEVSFPVWQRCVSRCPSVEGGLCNEGTMCKSDSDCRQGEVASDACCKCKKFYKNPDKTDSAPDFYEKKRK
jgi:hypothetical protein|tara:strand:+ start:143 stop:418 length:276 start_codon:yes stop_codon:yes gene_type:complete